MAALARIVRASSLTAGLTALVAVALPTTPAPSIAAGFNPGVIAAYSIAAPRSEAASRLIARAVIPRGAACPNVVVHVSGRSAPDEVVMYGRNLPTTTAPAFESITVCSARMPNNALSASIMGHPIPAHLPTRVRSLALLSDTGCRIKPPFLQDCGNLDSWPLASIAESIAEERPDAVVFAGDFYYREAHCPAEVQNWCGSSPPPVAGLPFKDSAYGWIAEVLLPMAPLLSTAPLIIARGNHEACNRGGNGYFLLFDPRRDTTDTCAPIAGPDGLAAPPTTPTPTYTVDLPITADRTLRLAIVDTAGGIDTRSDAFAPIQRPAFVAAANLTKPRAGVENWLVTHRPVFGYASPLMDGPPVPFEPWVGADSQTAASFGLLDHFDLVFSSHIHIGQAVQIPGQPGQLILGNGGTLLDPLTGYPLPTTGPTDAAGQAYPPPVSAWIAPRFGYAIARPNAQAGSWRIEVNDPLGRQFARCGVANRQIYCRDLPR
jgi:3',5'-cyclic AMP phosphodiesterase CpdA